MARAGTRSTQRPALCQRHRWLPRQPLPPPLPHPHPASRPQPGPPLGGGGRGEPNGPKWAQSAKRCPFCISGAQNAKKCSFCISGAQNAKKGKIPLFGTKKCKIRCRNHWFHKHLRPGGKNDPKIHFWAPKCILGPKCEFGPKMRFRAPKCSPGKGGQGGLALFRTAVVKSDVSKMLFCEKSGK